MKPSASSRPDCSSAVEIGRQRQAREFAGQGQMHAEVELRLLVHQIDRLREPGAGHHDRGGGDEALAGEFDEGAIGAVAHADVVDVRNQNPRIRRIAEVGGETGHQGVSC